MKYSIVFVISLFLAVNLAAGCDRNTACTDPNQSCVRTRDGEYVCLPMALEGQRCRSNPERSGETEVYRVFPPCSMGLSCTMGRCSVAK